MHSGLQLENDVEPYSRPYSHPPGRCEACFIRHRGICAAFSQSSWRAQLHRPAAHGAGPPLHLPRWRRGHLFRHDRFGRGQAHQDHSRRRAPHHRTCLCSGVSRPYFRGTTPLFGGCGHRCRHVHLPRVSFNRLLDECPSSSGGFSNLQSANSTSAAIGRSCWAEIVL